MASNSGPHDDHLARIAARFRRFADLEARDYSPLCERLSRGIAQDAELLALAAAAQPGQPPPNLFLAAVHALLLAGAGHPLGRFYPSVTGEAAPPGEPMPDFREFCLARRADIDALLRSRRVQTNEVGRSACLLPAFNHVAALSNAPLALVEIGASAGLNLLCDRYHYDYGDLGEAGDPSSPVSLHCRVLGGGRPPVEAVPAIGYRIGVDLDPVDVFDDEATAWLRALVWPEHTERAALLRAAIELARREPPKVLAGDGIELLPSLLEGVPADLTVCVFHSFVLNQVPRGRRERLYEVLAEHSWQRPIFDLSFEGTPDGIRTAAIEMSRSVRGEWRRSLLARCQAHGQTLEWLV